MSIADRLYRHLLRAYPRAFRAEFGAEMAILVRDRQRHDGIRGIRLWADIVWDVLRSAPALRLEALRHPWDNATRDWEETMRKLSMLAILSAIVELENTTQTIWVDGGWHHGTELLLGMVGTAASLLLLIAGITLWRESPRSRAFARAAAAACLPVFAVVNAIPPLTSYSAMAIGIAVPIIMLFTLRATGTTKGDLLSVA